MLSLVHQRLVAGGNDGNLHICCHTVIGLHCPWQAMDYVGRANEMTCCRRQRWQLEHGLPSFCACHRALIDLNELSLLLITLLNLMFMIHESLNSPRTMKVLLIFS